MKASKADKTGGGADKSNKAAGGKKRAHALTLEEQLDGTEDALGLERRGKARRAAAAASAAETEQPSAREAYVAPKITRRILKQAHEQQQEEEQAARIERAPHAERLFTALSDAHAKDTDDEDDALSDGGESLYQEDFEVAEEDERALAAFMAPSGPQRTLADVIMERIKEKSEGRTADGDAADGGGAGISGLDSKVVEVYTGVGKLLKRYTAGKVPKAFKIIPALTNWEEILYLTQPDDWSPNAMYQATRLFASNLNAKMAQRFYSLVLLPRIRSDIREHHKLHFALYQSLKKAVYKPAAFYKGIVLPICQAGDCTLREAVILSSVITKTSIPVLHSAVALLKIAETPWCGTNSFFISTLLNKKYALPYRVVDALVRHFVSFKSDERMLPVVWHQSVLTFVQRRVIMVRQNHTHVLMADVTPEVHRELNQSRARGEKEDSMDVSIAVPKIAADEDPRNFPTVEILMDED
eukprot:jgi/Chlat1/8428/Chrsp80S07844